MLPTAGSFLVCECICTLDANLWCHFLGTVCFVLCDRVSSHTRLTDQARLANEQVSKGLASFLPQHWDFKPCLALFISGFDLGIELKSACLSGKPQTESSPQLLV